MKSFVSIVALILAVASPALAQTQGVSTALLNRFIQMATICMSAYVGDLCLLPDGLPKVADITNTATDVHGWILRDDAAQEIIVAFRGTESVQNYESDTNYTLANFDTYPSCTGCQVHGGYYLLWASVYENVQSLIQDQVSLYPDYGIVITGHSLGGSLAALAAAQFSSVFDNITVYTLGEPRTGNPAFATFIDDTYKTSSPDTTSFYRCTHTDDGVPHVPPVSDGYLHHGLEYWNVDPTSTSTTYICGAETTECNGQYNTSGINLAHLTYFGHTVIVGAVCI
ncbi:feruloyl esterase A [Hyaloscypha variabilis]